MDGGNYIKEGRDSAKSTCLIFSPKEEAVGALANSLKLFEVQYVKLKNLNFCPGAREFLCWLKLLNLKNV